MPNTSNKPPLSIPDTSIVLPGVLPFLLMPFVLLHLLAGWSYYVENLEMALSAVTFVVALLAVAHFQRRIGSGCPPLLDGTELGRLRRSRLATGLGLIALGWHGYVFGYIQLVLGVSAEEARILQSSVFSGFVMLPMYAVSLTGFTLVCLRQATRPRSKRLIVTFDTLVILMILLAVFASWTRALLAQYVWILVMVNYVFGRISLQRLAILGLAILVAMASIKLARYVLANDALTLEYYRGLGAFDAGHPWRSVGSFLLIHLNDNPWRAFMTFEYVPDRYQFQYGRSTFFDFVTILPGQQFNPNVGLSWYVMNGPLVEREFPPTLLAQGWFDFGFPGAIIYAMLYPLLTFFLWLRCHRRPDLLRVVVLAFFLFNLVIGFYGAPSWLFFILFAVTFRVATLVMGIRR